MDFDTIAGIGRFESDRCMERFCNGLYALADDTMIRREIDAPLRRPKASSRSRFDPRIRSCLAKLSFQSIG